ncbi:MAG: LLM class flavin-dependent oxidoreductase, partial [Rhodospirillales bacterium]|nr:LLM class flavin-dependent oxidoreductase [Rhodospirillales bacterium]
VTLAACLARTTTLRVATGVTQPTTRHVSVTASAIATLHEMAPGRAMLGLGTGFSSLRTIGKRAARIDEMEAYTRALHDLLQARTTTFDAGVEAGLSWLTAPTGVPIHLAASGPRMTRRAASIGDGVILLQGIAPELLGRALLWLQEGLEAASRQSDAVEVSCWVPFSLDTDRQCAYARARARVAGALVQANPELFEGEERRTIEDLKQHYEVGDHARAVAAHAASIPDSLVRKFAVAGDAAEVREQLSALRAHSGLDRIILTPQISGEGALPMQDVLRHLGNDVLPRL